MRIYEYEFLDHDIVSAESSSENSNILNVEIDVSNLVDMDGEIIEIHRSDVKAMAIHFGLIKE